MAIVLFHEVAGENERLDLKSINPANPNSHSPESPTAVKMISDCSIESKHYNTMKKEGSWSVKATAMMIST